MKKRKALLFVLGALVLIVITLVLVSRCASPAQGTLEYESRQVEGLLETGRSSEEIQETLDRIVEKGRFSVSCNSAMNIKDGQMDVKIENIQGNQYDMQVDIELSGGEYDGLRIYSSKLIRPGFSIETGAVEENVNLPVGFYDAVATFSAFDQETQQKIGKTQAMIIVSVPNTEVANGE